MMQLIKRLRIPTIIFGSFLLFVSERYFASSAIYEILLGSAVTLLLVAVGISILNYQAAKSIGLEHEARNCIYSLGWMLLICLGVGFYFLYQNSLGALLVPETLTHKIFLSAFLLSFILGISSAIGIEWGRKQNGTEHLADSRQVGRVGFQWFSIGLLLAILVNVNYSAAQKDRTFDLSYLKMTKPGEATIGMGLSLDDPIDVVLFFPAGNQVLSFLESYFTQLETSGAKITIKKFDVDLNPAEAQKFKANANGLIIIAQGDQRHTIKIKTQLKLARKELKVFDAKFQKVLGKIVSPNKIAYFSRGHGEMSWNSGKPGLRSLKFIERLVKTQKYQVKLFGLQEGSAKKVPEDATVLIIAGPTRPFMQEEVKAIEAFVKQGGKLLVLFDVSSGDVNKQIFIDELKDPLREFVDSVGVTFQAEILAHDSKFVSVRKTNADRWFLFTNIFTSHQSVKNLAKHEERVPVLFFQSGHLKVNKNKKPWKAFETIRALPNSFVDLNKNYQFDPKTEKRKSYAIGAAAVIPATGKKSPTGEQREGRVLVIADATAVSDGIIATGVPGNQLLISDGLRWLADEFEFGGATNSERDVKIRHTKDQDAMLFYSTIFGFPAMVLFAGVVATRRRKKRG
jgi:hypothetical protein